MEYGSDLLLINIYFFFPGIRGLKITARPIKQKKKKVNLDFFHSISHPIQYWEGF